MNSNSSDKIISFLKQDEIKNINLLNFMENNPVHSLEQFGNSVVMRGESDHHWVYISSPNEIELKVVIKNLTKDDRFFAVIEDWMVPFLTKDKKLVWQLSTIKLVLPKDVSFPKSSKFNPSSTFIIL